MGEFIIDEDTSEDLVDEGIVTEVDPTSGTINLKTKTSAGVVAISKLQELHTNLGIKTAPGVYKGLVSYIGDVQYSPQNY